MKKKLTSFFLVFCACFILLCASNSRIVFADEGYYASFSYDKASRTLSISGKCSDREQFPYVVTVISCDTPVSLINDSCLPVATKMAYTTDNGLIALDITLPQQLQSDRYCVYLSSANFCVDDYFIYATSSDIKSIFPALNAASSVIELKEVLGVHKKALGVDELIFSETSGADVMSSYLYSVRPPSGFSDVNGFSVSLDQAHAWALIKNGTDIVDVLKKYGNAIGISYESDFLKYPENVQSKLISLSKTADYTSKPFSDLIRELRVLSFVQSSTSWSSLKQAVLGVNSSGEVYVDNFALFNADSTEYAELSDKNPVFMEMFQKLANMKTFADVKKTFATAVQNAYENEHTDSNSSGKGSSSGSGSGSTGNTFSPLTPTLQKTFSDMDGHWANSYVQALYNSGIVSGFSDGFYRPEQPVTRAEFVKLVCEAFKLKSASKHGFSDVTDDDWFSKYIYTAVASGIIKGNDANLFLPNESITRQDACVVLYRCLDASSDIDINSLVFGDKSDISEYALNPIAFLYNESIISGVTSEVFEPKGSTTRAQAATLIFRVLEYVSAH